MGKEAKPVVETPVPANQDSHELSISSESLSARAAKELTPELIKQLGHIAYYVSKVGLTIDEACQLSGVNPEFFKKLRETNALIAEILAVKELEYKKDLLYTISRRAAAGGDDKLAMWLLERRYPDEFSTKKNSGNDDSSDLLFQAVSFIQKSGDNTPLVTEASGKAIVVKRVNAEQTESFVDKLKRSLS